MFGIESKNSVTFSWFLFTFNFFSPPYHHPVHTTPNSPCAHSITSPESSGSTLKVKYVLLNASDSFSARGSRRIRCITRGHSRSIGAPWILPYNLRCPDKLQLPKSKTAGLGIDTIKCLGGKVWETVPPKLKIVKRLIKIHRCDTCNCRLCKFFISI